MAAASPAGGSGWVTGCTRLITDTGPLMRGQRRGGEGKRAALVKETKSGVAEGREGSRWGRAKKGRGSGIRKVE